jgi:hypothetical protein
MSDYIGRAKISIMLHNIAKKYPRPSYTKGGGTKGEVVSIPAFFTEPWASHTFFRRPAHYCAPAWAGVQLVADVGKPVGPYAFPDRK